MVVVEVAVQVACAVLTYLIVITGIQSCSPLCVSFNRVSLLDFFLLLIVWITASLSSNAQSNNCMLNRRALSGTRSMLANFSCVNLHQVL